MQPWIPLFPWGGPAGGHPPRPSRRGGALGSLLYSRWRGLGLFYAGWSFTQVSRYSLIKPSCWAFSFQLLESLCSLNFSKIDIF